MATPTPALRSIVKERPVFQQIVYSQCWEDPDVARDGLELGAEDDLLCLTSAGDNVLALSLARPRSIVALDFSSAQNALLELKIAAIRHLTWHEYVAFLGARAGADRTKTYRTKLRSALTDDARTYFDHHQRAIAEGVIHSGRFQRYLQIFRRGVLPLIHSRSTVREMMSLEDPAERAAYYDEHWANRRWNKLFTAFFGRAIMARLGRDPAFFKYVEERNIGAEFLERTRWALVETNPIENHFMQYALLGEYPDLSRGPVYLREANFASLRETVDTIDIRQGDLEGYLSSCDAGDLSKIYLSDLFEWVDETHLEQMMQSICRVLRPGGRMVYWNLLVPRSRPDSMSHIIERHRAEAERLHGRDLAFVYGDFHVESVH